MKKGTKLYSIAHLKCPRCQEADLFSSKAYNIKHMLDMPDHCPVCRQDYKIEPGFYSGALWISYPFVILILIPIAVLQIVYLDLSFPLAFFFSLIIMLGLQPLIMRFSRAIWINIFVSYDTDKQWLDEF